MNISEFIKKSILISFFALIIYEIFSEIYELRAYPKYTVAVIIKFRRGRYEIKETEYKFSVNGKEYLRAESYRGGEVGKRYFVKFSSENPRREELLTDKPVPDTLQFIPPEGWDKLPKIRRY